MDKLISQGEASPNNYAYLFDRTYRPQRYDTQGACAGLENGYRVRSRMRRRSITGEPQSRYIRRNSPSTLIALAGYANESVPNKCIKVRAHCALDRQIATLRQRFMHGVGSDRERNMKSPIHKRLPQSGTLRFGRRVATPGKLNETDDHPPAMGVRHSS